MTKWKILNIIAFFLLWLVIIASYYSFLYPASFIIGSLLKLVEWEPFLLLYIALLLLAFTLSFIFWNKTAFQKTVFKTSFILHIAAIITMVILGGTKWNDKRKELSELLSEIKQQAAKDIQADSIRYVSRGLPVPDRNYMKRDSIMANYGIYYTFNCVIDQFTIKGDMYYKQLTKDYLNKRNGKNWEIKMQGELACDTR